MLITFPPTMQTPNDAAGARTSDTLIFFPHPISASEKNRSQSIRNDNITIFFTFIWFKSSISWFCNSHVSSKKFKEKIVTKFSTEKKIKFN